jgi:hypothetical protein
MSGHTVELNVTLHIERDGDTYYIREAVVESDQSIATMCSETPKLCDLVRLAINDKLAGQDVPVEDGQ